MARRPDSRLPRRIERAWTGDRPADRLVRTALIPAEFFFRIGVSLRNLMLDQRILPVRGCRIPVISVGNLTVGGSGKTPFSAYLAREMLARGQRPAVLHGGYALDEPALHREWNPGVDVVVGRDRVRMAEQAILRGATVIVLDDGFQHRRLARDLDIVLVPAESWNPAPRLLPRGPWREAPAALKRSDLVVVTRKTASSADARRIVDETAPFRARAAALVAALRPDGWECLGDAAMAPGASLAVSSIAQPDLFEQNAAEAGATLEDSLRYADHHVYTQSDAAHILAAARGRPIVTTSKDAIKLKHLIAPERLRVLQQRVEIEFGEERLAAALDSVLQ